MVKNPETKPGVIGVFEGECADANITNNNGLDIVREVWEDLFASDQFARGIKYGWFIGFLGHPAQPDCMDYKHGCIVMTEGHIEPDGKVKGKFNLIDTPVGRIVKTLIDAGVQFGISVRGAGDVVGNSVTPGTFDFRGFDLVSFPAFPESIPTFKPIAASTDVESAKKYSILCSTVMDNIKDVTDDAALDIIQQQFAPQSDVYKAIEEKRNTRINEGSEDESLDSMRISALVSMYTKLKQDYDKLQAKCNAIEYSASIAASEANRKLASVNRIYANQIKIYSSKAADSENKISELQSDNARLSRRIEDLSSKNTRLENKNKILSSTNLKYNMKIQNTEDKLADKERQLSELSSDLSETVRQSEVSANRASNLDDTVKALKTKLSTVNGMLKDYQHAYAELYASAVGASYDSASISASTTVSDLKQSIGNQYANVQDSDTQSALPDIDWGSDTASDLITL